MQVTVIGILAWLCFTRGPAPIGVALAVWGAYVPVGLFLRFLGALTVGGSWLGGGFLYPRVELRTDEFVKEEIAECGTTRTLYGRLFLTNQRLIHLPNRSVIGGKRGKPTSIELRQVESATAALERGFSGRGRVEIVSGDSVELIPLFGVSAEKIATAIQTAASNARDTLIAHDH